MLNTLGYVLSSDSICPSTLFIVRPEMRQKFDAGEDPLDPESQQGGGGGQQGWPFHFNPFDSGGSFHFKFQYN